jgi:hypothetical protein
MDKRRLPKSGVEPLDFEDDQYLADQVDARARVMSSFEKLSKKKGDSKGYLPLKYDADVIRNFYDRDPIK